jgi:hypothetical protein
MITRGIQPPPVELRAWMLSQGCPDSLMRSVADKNARLVETRSRVAAKRTHRATTISPGVSRAEIQRRMDLLGPGCSAYEVLGNFEQLEAARDRRLQMIQTIL